MLHIHTLSQLCSQRDSLSSIRVSLPGCALRSMNYSARFSRSSPSAPRRSFRHIETEDGELAKRGDLDEIRTKNNPSTLPSSFIALSCAGSARLTVGQRPKKRGDKEDKQSVRKEERLSSRHQTHTPPWVHRDDTKVVNGDTQRGSIC